MLPATGASAAAGAAPAAAATTAPPDGTDANFLEPATSQRRWFYFQGCVTIKTNLPQLFNSLATNRCTDKLTLFTMCHSAHAVEFKRDFV